MFGISAPEVFADLVIGGGPEAFQIVGDLHGAVVWTEKVQQAPELVRGPARGVSDQPKSSCRRTARIGGRPGS